MCLCGCVRFCVCACVCEMCELYVFLCALCCAYCGADCGRGPTCSMPPQCCRCPGLLHRGLGRSTRVRHRVLFQFIIKSTTLVRYTPPFYLEHLPSPGSHSHCKTGTGFPFSALSNKRPSTCTTPTASRCSSRRNGERKVRQMLRHMLPRLC